MKVDSVTMLDGGLRALVVLKPSWFGRLLGAPWRCIELIKDPDASEDRVWRSQATQRLLPWMKYGDLIREALEAQPMPTPAPLPKARVVSEPHVAEPYGSTP